MNTDGADETLPTTPVETTAVVRVPAVRGAMGNTTYYLATVPMGAAVKLFAHDRSEDSLPSEERHQRKLARSGPMVAGVIHREYAGLSR